MRGLDPRIHDEAPGWPSYELPDSLRLVADGGVKPSHDGG
jgi:hypothetical protein